MNIWKTWRALPCLEGLDMASPWNAPYLPIVEQLVTRMLKAGLEPSRARMKMEFETDDEGHSVRMMLKRHDRDGGIESRFVLRLDQSTSRLDDALARLSLMLARQDRILGALGEAGRFRSVDPAWSYRAHPVLAAHLRGCGVTPEDFVRTLPHNGSFRSPVEPVSPKTSMNDPQATMVDARLGYLDGSVTGGDIRLSKIEFGAQVFFRYAPARLELRGIEMPQTMQAAVLGRPAIEVVDHPALEVEGLVIKSIRRIGGRFCLTIPADNVPIAPGRPEGFEDAPPPIPLPENATAA